jgi:hypothetical protein
VVCYSSPFSDSIGVVTRISSELSVKCVASTLIAACMLFLSVPCRNAQYILRMITVLSIDQSSLFPIIRLDIFDSIVVSISACHPQDSSQEAGVE